MAKTLKRKIKENSVKAKEEKGFFSKIKATESYTSLIMGAIVVLIIGILFVTFSKIGKNLQTSSDKDSSLNEEQGSQAASSTYTVKPGDNLWTISENVYKDGYKWQEIAKANKLENPGLIFTGDKLLIPSVAQKEDSNNVSGQPEKSNSISGNSYAVIEGDNLWDIAVRAYGDGFKWPEIAKENNLANPSVIHPGNIFKIPR